MVAHKYPIILASNSPRRSDILRQAGFEFLVVSKNVEEIYPDGLDKTQIPVYLAKLKAMPIFPEITNELLIAADTIVWINNKVIGKPKDKREAMAILKEISGNTHEVITGVYMTKNGQEKSFYSISKVTFGKISDLEIEKYIDECKPMDKAGSYGIQDWIGLKYITHIEGCYYNIMGFPMSLVYSYITNWK